MQEHKLTFIEKILIQLPKAINPHYSSYVCRQINDVIEDDIGGENKKYQKIVKILRDFPEVNLNNSSGKRLLPYHVAYLKGYTKITKLLIAHGADPTKSISSLNISSLLLDLFKIESTLFETKLKYTEEFILAAIDDLVKLGADVNVCISGKSPLERAIRFDCRRVAEALLKKYQATMDYTQYKEFLKIAYSHHNKSMFMFLMQDYSIPQDRIRNKLARYLIALQHGTREIYDNADLIQNLLDNRLDGHCCGLSSLWLYLKLLELQPVDSDKPRDTIEWFYETQQVLSRWNDDKLSSLTANEQKDIDRFLQLIVFPQDPYQWLPVAQGDLESYLEDTKGRRLRRDLNIVVELTCDKLGKHFNTLLNGRKAVLIASINHTIARIRQQDEYILYNPNSPIGEIELNSTQEISRWIFDGMEYDENNPSSLVFQGVT